MTCEKKWAVRTDVAAQGFGFPPVESSHFPHLQIAEPPHLSPLVMGSTYTVRSRRPSPAPIPCGRCNRVPRPTLGDGGRSVVRFMLTGVCALAVASVDGGGSLFGGCRVPSLSPLIRLRGERLNLPTLVTG